MSLTDARLGACPQPIHVERQSFGRPAGWSVVDLQGWQLEMLQYSSGYPGAKLEMLETTASPAAVGRPFEVSVQRIRSQQMPRWQLKLAVRGAGSSWLFPFPRLAFQTWDAFASRTAVFCLKLVFRQCA